MTNEKFLCLPIEEIIRQAGSYKGIFVQDLAVGDELIIETMNSTYTLTVTDPHERKVVARGGKHLPDPTETYCNGSSLTGTGSMMRMGWIAVGFRLWIGDILLSETREVILNGAVILTSDGELVQ